MPNYNPIFPGTINCPAVRIQNSDGTAFVTLMAGGASGSKVETISATTDDTVTRVLQLAMTVGAVDYPLGEVSITLGAGTDGATKAINVLNATDLPWIRNDGVNNYLYIPSGATLKAKSKVAVTAAKFINLFIQGGDF